MVLRNGFGGAFKDKAWEAGLYMDVMAWAEEPIRPQQARGQECDFM